MYHVVHNTCTMHGRDIKTRYIGSTSILLLRKIEILSDSIECNHSSRNTSSLLYSKSCEDENWRSLIRQVYMSPRPPPKISLKHEWKRELGSKVARQPEGEVARLANFSNRGDLMTFKMEETRPVLRRSMLILSTKNSVLQTERCDLLRDAFRENPFIRRV